MNASFVKALGVALAVVCAAQTAAAQSPPSRSEIKKMINGAAKGILFCAHPSGEYKQVTVNDVHVDGERVAIEFTIDYRCKMIERPCAITLEAAFQGEKFERVTVLRDTALTNPNLGLRTCRDLVRALAR